MEDLIRIEAVIIQNGTTNGVDAKLLHEFLEVKTAFSDWIKKRINDYNFSNEFDYLKVRDLNYSGIGQAPVNYTLSMDMAKELSMVERNEKGQEARKYFIKCEKALQGQTYLERHNLPNFMDPAISARAWAEQVELKQVALAERDVAVVERDEAIKFRQRIDDKRAASAMGTAAKYSKENVKLRKELEEVSDIFAQLNQFVVGRGACLTIS